jgi:5-methylcytosine-specific restriction endonuclease McrA
MTRTLRSESLRYILWKASNGKCQNCGCDLDPMEWHAHHIEAWVRSHRTNVHEMEALCPKCNLKIGSRKI